MSVADNVIKMAKRKAEEIKTVSKFPAPPIDKINYRAKKEPLFRLLGKNPDISLDDINLAISKMYPDYYIQALEITKGSLIHRTDVDPTSHPVSVSDPLDPAKRKIVERPNMDFFGIMKKRYAIVDNPDLDEPIREQLYDSLPKEALTEGSVELVEKTSEGGSIARWGYHFNGLGREIRQLNKSKTQLNFMVRIVNSFGGQTGIRLQAGALDLFCTNGCTSAELSSQSFGHTIGFDPSQVKKFIEEQVDFFQKRVELWQSWANKEITASQASEFLKKAFPASASEIKKAEEKGFTVGEATSRKMRKMMEQLEAEAEERGHTIWALYSALTNYSSHNSDRFGVKNSANSDNVETTLIEREREVNKVIELPEFKELELA